MVNATTINKLHFWKKLKIIFRIVKRVLTKLQSSYEFFIDLDGCMNKGQKVSTMVAMRSSKA
jgi:hypothetical protein